MVTVAGGKGQPGGIFGAADIVILLLDQSFAVIKYIRGQPVVFVGADIFNDLFLCL